MPWPGMKGQRCKSRPFHKKFFRSETVQIWAHSSSLWRPKVKTLLPRRRAPTPPARTTVPVVQYRLLLCNVTCSTYCSRCSLASNTSGSGPTPAMTTEHLCSVPQVPIFTSSLFHAQSELLSFPYLRQFGSASKKAT